jgi:putative endonuclease
MYFSYILKSLKDGKYYYGHCSDLEQRLKQHNLGKVRSTKSRKPFILHYNETFTTKSEAYRRELFFKSLEGRIWLKQNNII